MPARGSHKGEVRPAHIAALRYLDEGVPMRDLAEEMGLTRPAISQALARIRDQRGIERPRARSRYEATGQSDWLECCQSPDHHRFDCPAVRERRAKAYLPIAPMSTRQLVDRLRTERAA